MPSKFGVVFFYIREKKKEKENGRKVLANNRNMFMNIKVLKYKSIALRLKTKVSNFIENHLINAVILLP